MPNFIVNWQISGKIRIESESVEIAIQKVVDDYSPDDLLSKSDEESLVISSDYGEEIED